MKGETLTYCKSMTGDDSVQSFVIFAIEQYKHHKNISGQESMEILSEAGILQHLQEFYDVMHLHGSKWLMQEIDAMVERQNLLREGTVK